MKAISKASSAHRPESLTLTLLRKHPSIQSFAFIINLPKLDRIFSSVGYLTSLLPNCNVFRLNCGTKIITL